METQKHCTQGQLTHKNSGNGGTVDTEERWAMRNSKHKGTVGTDKTMGIEDKWAQRNSGHRNIGHRGKEGIEYFTKPSKQFNPSMTSTLIFCFLCECPFLHQPHPPPPQK